MRRNLKTILLSVMLFNSNSFSQNSYFPLNIGNYWKYNYTLDILWSVDTSCSIVDTLTIKSKLYYELNNASFVLLPFQKYIRMDKNNRLLGFMESDSTEILIFDFSSKADTIYRQYDIDVIAYDTIYYRLFNRNIPTITLSGGARERIYFLEGIGVGGWYIDNFVADYNLIECFIKDKLYSNVNKKEITMQSILIGAYPSPFNSILNIEIQSPNAESYTMKIYNIFGEEVYQLIDNKVLYGLNKFIWKPNNLSSGVYLLNLRTHNVNKTIKLLFQK
jgi:hypothetical protein